MTTRRPKDDEGKPAKRRYKAPRAWDAEHRRRTDRDFENRGWNCRYLSSTRRHGRKGRTP